MKKIILLILCLMQLVSCSMVQEVKVVLKEKSVYSKALSRKIWYTLEYNCKGETIKKHLETDTCTLMLPSNETTYVALYPNGDGYPLTGYRQGREKTIELSYANTRLIKLILELNKDFSKIVKSSNFDKIKKVYDKKKIKYAIDKEKFAYDFLYKRVVNSSFIEIMPWWVKIGKLQPGLYICDNPTVDSITVTKETTSNVVKLSPGVYNYLCDLNNTKVTVYVNDLSEISNGEINSYVDISKL